MTPDPLPEIRLGAMAFTVDHWLRRTLGHDGDSELFDLNAPYQRGSVWSTDMKRGLIKSLLMGLPVGNIVVSKLPYKEGISPYRIVDGKQRIEALRSFTEDEFHVPGWWFPEKDLLHPQQRESDVYFSELSPRGQRGLGNAQMPALEFSPEFEWYENPDYDREWAEANKYDRTGDHRAKPWLTRNRTWGEMLQEEAQVYLLINFGGVAQTDEDRERAEGFAS